MQYEVDYQPLIPYNHMAPKDETRTRTKFDEFVELCLKQGIEMANMMEGYPSAFSLDNATGKQLDILGALAGVSRKLPKTIDGATGELEDEDFRFLIQGQILASMWDGTNEGLTRLLSESMVDYNIRFRDNQDMTMDFYIEGDMSTVKRNLLINNVIRYNPAGCEVTYNISDSLVTTVIHAATLVSSLEQRHSAETRGES